MSQQDAVRFSIELLVNDANDTDVVESASAIVVAFADACGAGMLSGEQRRPEDAGRSDVVERREGGRLQFDVDAASVAPESVRVLLGMLKGDFGIADSLASLTASVSYPGGPHLVRQVADEATVPAPGRYRSIAFDVSMRQVARTRAQRLVRVRFIRDVADEGEARLVHLQNTWLRLCRGGLVENGRPPHESFVAATTGYLISPRMFEIPVQAFEVPERAFDILLNGLHRYSVLDQQVERVDIW